MAREAAADHEDRTRVICHLPLNNAAEELALKDVIAHVEAQRRRRVGVDGYTYSDPTAFHGRWWQVEGRDWVGDQIVMLMVDYRISLTRKRVSLSGEIARLKKCIQDAYRKHGRPQEEIWVVAHRVTRHA
jgi:hypothetical protein